MPRIEFTGDNGKQIAAELTNRANKANSNRPVVIEVNDDHPGPSLSLNQVFYDGQVGVDRYRIPVGMSVITETGQVVDSKGNPQDYAELITID
jgi:hypothetical protein